VSQWCFLNTDEKKRRACEIQTLWENKDDVLDRCKKEMYTTKVYYVDVVRKSCMGWDVDGNGNAFMILFPNMKKWKISTLERKVTNIFLLFIP